MRWIGRLRSARLIVISLRVQMKKNRPGVFAFNPSSFVNTEALLSEMLFAETTTLGIRSVWWWNGGLLDRKDCARGNAVWSL